MGKIIFTIKKENNKILVETDSPRLLQVLKNEIELELHENWVFTSAKYKCISSDEKTSLSVIEISDLIGLNFNERYSIEIQFLDCNLSELQHRQLIGVDYKYAIYEKQ